MPDVSAAPTTRARAIRPYSTLVVERAHHLPQPTRTFRNATLKLGLSQTGHGASKPADLLIWRQRPKLAYGMAYRIFFPARRDCDNWYFN